MLANVNFLAFEVSAQAALAQTDDEEYGIQALVKNEGASGGRSTTNHEADHAGPNIKVLSKGLILNASTADQKDVIREKFGNLLDAHGPGALDAACAQALASGRSSLKSVAAIISNESDDTPEFQQNTTDAITHSNIRGAGYFN